MTPQCAVEAGLSCGDVAQLVERLLCKQDVAGSNPVISTNTKPGSHAGFCIGGGLAIQLGHDLPHRRRTHPP